MLLLYCNFELKNLTFAHVYARYKSNRKWYTPHFKAGNLGLKGVGTWMPGVTRCSASIWRLGLNWGGQGEYSIPSEKFRRKNWTRLAATSPWNHQTPEAVISRPSASGRLWWFFMWCFCLRLSPSAHVCATKVACVRLGSQTWRWPKWTNIVQ